MSKEELTPEEAEMLEVMARDDVPEPQEEATEQAEETTEEVATEEQAEGDEPKPEFKSSRNEEKPPEGFVPHQAMHAERMRRQELERKLEALEARLTQPEPEQPPQYVDPLEDPEGHRRYVDYLNQQNAQRVEALQRQIQMQQQQQHIAQSVAQAEQQFMASKSDYNDAIRFLQETRMKELTAQGYDTVAARQQMSRDAMSIYQAAQQMGMNPAEMAYMRAQSLGYTPKQAQSEAKKVEALAKAQEQTSGISGGGAPQKGKLTLKSLAEMSEKELAEIPEQEIRKVMGE